MVEVNEKLSEAVEDPNFKAACQMKREGKKSKSKEAQLIVIPGKCPFINRLKKKVCRKELFKKPDGTKSEFCRFHAYQDTPDVEFVFCPYEPKNRLLKTALESHLKVCPKALEISKMETQPFFNKGINFFQQSPIVEEEKKEANVPGSDF